MKVYRWIGFESRVPTAFSGTPAAFSRVLVAFTLVWLLSSFGMGSALAASTEDFSASDFSSDERAVIGNVRVVEGDEDITSRCRICFRVDLSECFELGSKGVVYYKRKGGSQRVTSMSCTGKEPDRVAVRGFTFAVDPRVGVATYFGSVVLKGNFEEKLFQVDSVSDRYAEDVNPFHRQFGNRMAVRYMRSLPLGSIHSAISKEGKPRSDETPISAVTEKENAQAPKSWFIDFGIDGVLGTKYTDSTNEQSLIYDQKSVPGYSRSQFAHDANFYWVLNDARTLLFGGGYVYAHDDLKTSTFELTQNLTGFGPSLRYYYYGEVLSGAYFRSEVGVARRNVSVSGIGSSSLTTVSGSDSGGFFSIGLGGDLRVFSKVSLGVSGSVLFDSVKSGGESFNSRRGLLGLHLLF